MSSSPLRPVWILGSGRSGQAAAALARSQGREVRILDEQAGDLLPAEEGGSTVDWVVSPGFPIEHPWCEAVREAGGDLIPEMEFGATCLSGEIVAITGSLGKTSMVMFAAELLRTFGYSVTISGNIGTPVSEVALTQPEADVHVIEASSFQLEAIRWFCPDRAVCLNLFPNHLDRHGELEAYAAAKARLFSNMTPLCTAVWPESYPVPVDTQARVIDPQTIEVPPCEGTRFAHGPLRENLRMLLACLQGIPGLDSPLIEQTTAAFTFPDHRMQELDIPGAGRVVDDSKSTCFAATRAAVDSIPGKLHLIMGGIDKEEDPREMAALLKERNPVLYLYGRSGKKMRDAWQDSVDVCFLTDSLEDVKNLLVKTRTSMEEPIVLSPGCASFDQFDGFEARGDHFQSLIRDLATFHPL